MIDNPLEINDWEIKNFLMAVLVVQLVMLGLLGLDALGFGIPVLRQIVGFVYLSFIPGLIILRILGLHRLGSIKTLLYSVGLSLAFNMFLGFVINMLYPRIGISRPLSTLPLMITWAVVLCLLCFIAYKRDKGFSMPTHFKVGDLLSPPVLLLILLPLLSIVGTQVVNFYKNNVLLLALIALIALIGLVIMLTNFIHVRFHALAVFSIALALLWHVSLISSHLTGYDIFTEYYYYSLVAQSGLWDLSIHHTYNAMLSITVLPAIFSNLLDMGGEQIFKIIYPLWYALVPLALYMIYGKQLKTKQAFSAVFLFMSIWVFYLAMYSVARQMIAELFLVLLIMLITDREATTSMTALFILFGASLVVSHYALSYIYMGFLILSLIILYLLREKSFHITAYSVVLLSVICLAWYMYVSASAPFDSVVNIGKHIWQNLYTDLLNPFSRDISSIFLGTSPSALHLIYRIVYYLILFFIAIGAWKLVTGLLRKESPKEYLTLATGSYILLAACIAVPFFSEQLGVPRMFHLAAIVLAPFCILGAEITVDTAFRLTRCTARLAFRSGAKMMIGPLLVLFFLLDSGFAFEVTNNPKLTSLALSLNAVEDTKRDVYLENKIWIRYVCPTEQEVSSATWLAHHMDKTKVVYATYMDIRVPALIAYGLIPEAGASPIIPSHSTSGSKSGYIYLGYVNGVYGYGITNWRFLPYRTLKSEIWDISQISPLLHNSVKVYTNGPSEIYWSP